jgi:ubiquitin-protein ligase
MFHCNVDKEGNICVPILKDGTWSSALGLAKVLEAIYALLANPDAEGATTARAAGDSGRGPAL